MLNKNAHEFEINCWHYAICWHYLQHNVIESCADHKCAFRNLWLPKLEILGLRNAAVTDASIGSFSKMTSLRGLYITGTDVSEAGVEQIQKALPNCSIRRSHKLAKRSAGHTL